MSKKYEMNFDTFLKNFKKHVSKLKLKNSIQKDYILKTLYFSEEHLTAEEITYKIRGMNRDLSESVADPQFAFDIQNMRLMTSEDNTLYGKS